MYPFNIEAHAVSNIMYAFVESTSAFKVFTVKLKHY